MLGIIIMYGVAKAHTPHLNYVFFGIGASLLFAGNYRLYFELRDEKNRSFRPDQPRRLQEKQYRNPVDLSRCTVIGNSWTQVREEKTTKKSSSTH